MRGYDQGCDIIIHFETYPLHLKQEVVFRQIEKKDLLIIYTKELFPKYNVSLIGYTLTKIIQYLKIVSCQ